MKIKLHVTKDKFEMLDLDALIALEEFGEGGTNFRGFRSLLMPFMVDENGEELTEFKAKQILGKLKVTEIKEVAAEFSRAINEHAVPKPNGKRSSKPSGIVAEDPPGSAS